MFVADFLTWTRLSIKGFTPEPCIKHCAVLVSQHHTSRRNHSLPMLRGPSSGGGLSLQRASTGHGRRRHERQTEETTLQSRQSQQSVETTTTELRTDDDCTRTVNEISDADGCCNVCTSSLRRNHRISNDCNEQFNSSREQLVLSELDLRTVPAALMPSSQPGQHLGDSTECADAGCSCHHGSVNPTFVSDDTASQRSQGYTVSSSGCGDHAVAAQALMQPLDCEETVDKGQMVDDAPMEMICFSLCRNGNRLVVEDLESNGGLVSSVEVNGLSHPPWRVREAWPDKTTTTIDLDELNNDKQLLVCRHRSVIVL